jgi:hypothetical protein
MEEVVQGKHSFGVPCGSSLYEYGMDLWNKSGVDMVIETSMVSVARLVLQNFSTLLFQLWVHLKELWLWLLS